jgi:two-component system nitrate/nitrite response regulator NarL
MPIIHAMLLTSVRLFGEALERCLAAAENVALLRVLSHIDELERALTEIQANVVLVDVTQDIDFRQVSELVVAHPQIAFIALGLQEQASQVIRAGKSGFSGYVARDASIATLVESMTNAAAGRLSCSCEVASHLLRALFQQTAPQAVASWANGTAAPFDGLTRRERDVAHLVGRGFSNKEIARDLCLSLGTVKHHVHRVLEKLQLDRRAQVPARLSHTDTPGQATPDLRGPKAITRYSRVRF